MDIRDLVAEEKVYDPLEVDEQISQEEMEPIDEQPLIGEPLDVVDPDERRKADDRPAQIRIRELLAQMPGQRRLLLKLIDYCRYAKTGQEMDEFTVKLQENAYSVYSPVVLRELLEQAGAIVYLPDDEEEVEGSLAQEGEALQAQMTCADDAGADAIDDAGKGEAYQVKTEVYDDGEEQVDVEFLEIGEAKPGAWLASDEGLQIVDSQDDEKATWNLLDQTPRYLSVYQQVIEYCTEDGGRSIKELDKLVNDNPLLQEPRRYSGYFIARLEKSGAIEWRNGWRTTSIGEKILQTLVSNAAKAAGEAVLG